VSIPSENDAGIQEQMKDFKVVIEQMNNSEELNDLLYQIGSYLVSDKARLSKWIAGIQQGFAEFFILSRQVYVEAKELEILKDFFTFRVENLKLRVHELLNEKEDLAAVHQSDTSIKEHLLVKMNELERTSVEKGTELLFQKKQTKELTEERD